MISANDTPGVNTTSFRCPHCRVLAQQFWHKVFADKMNKEAVPFLITQARLNELDFSKVAEADLEKTKNWAGKMASGRIFEESEDAGYRDMKIHNLHLARCYHCNEFSLWLSDKLIWPASSEAPSASADLPEELLADYDEASEILGMSPRGSAALLRLVVQKLCKSLGGKGKDINADIGLLVQNGLDVRIQQALDVVRVIGNNAVHPGQIDLRDDRTTATQLFRLINVIVEAMITQPKNISALYDALPEQSRTQIKIRDKK